MHSLRFGEPYRRQSERTEACALPSSGRGVRARIPPDIEVSLWEKLLVVVPFGGVGAVTRVPIGVTRSTPETRRLLERGTEEILPWAARAELPDPTTPSRRVWPSWMR